MEKIPLLSAPKDEEPTLNIRNLFVGNLLVVLFSISDAFHSPNLTQYMYKRISLEVFGNHTGDSSSPANITCFSNKTSDDYILQEKAQILTNRQQMYFSLASLSANFLGALFLGTYSDYTGRKMLFIIPSLGCMMRDIMITVIIHWELNFNWYFIGEVLSGLGGSTSGISLASYAYAADNTPPKKSRTIAIALMDSTKTIASAATNTATGYFIQDMGYFYPSLVSVLILVFLVIICSFFLREAPHMQQQKKTGKGSPIQAVRNVARLYVTNNTCKVRSLFWLGLIAYLFFKFSGSGVSNINTLFMLNFPFCWTPERIGYFTTGMTMLQQVFGVPLIKLMQLCVVDQVIGVFGSITVIASELLHGFASTDWMMYGYAIASGFSFAVIPVLRAIMSRMTPSSEQGAVFTSLTLADILMGITGVPACAVIYQKTVDYMKGFIFLVFAGTHTISTVFFLVFSCLTYRYSRRIQHEEDVTIQDKEWEPKKQDTTALSQSTEM